LWIALVVNAVMAVVEITGGVTADSVSLLADAVDFFGDAANYALSLFVLALAPMWRSRAALIKGLTMGAYGVFVLAKTGWNGVIGAAPEPITMGTIGVIALIAVTTARDIVDELEHSRLPRSVRLLVMMLVQYPRVLRDRYDQIVEAQIARGADRPRSIVQRATHGATLLLPVMQSELNAVGERAGLIHLRGLDVEVPATESAGRSGRDIALLVVAAILVASAVVVRLVR